VRNKFRNVTPLGAMSLLGPKKPRPASRQAAASVNGWLYNLHHPPLRVHVKRLPADSVFDRHFPKRSPRTKGHDARGRSTQLELITERTWAVTGADGAPIRRHRQ
jgi:hypothetical protein